MIKPGPIFHAPVVLQNPTRNDRTSIPFRIAAFLKNRRLPPALLAALLFGQSACAQAPVTFVINPSHAGPEISPNFSGLSYEMSLVLPGGNGKYFFSPQHKPLVQMFRTLGVKSLRVGGNSAERETVPVPARADIDSLFGFAKAAEVKVIYTLRMKGADPQADAGIAKYVMDHYGSVLACFSLGNEPEKIATNYPAYREAFGRYLAVITAPTNAPGATFCGPSTTHMNASWAGQFARDFGRDRRVVLVTQHEYPARSGRNVTNTLSGCDRLLSPDLLRVYETFHNEFVPAALSNGLPYRLEEANSFSNGGAAGVSDAFAAALWGLDYLYWWAAHGAAGVNFHTGGCAPGIEPRSTMKYAVFWNSPEGLAVRPLAYALKAFALAGNGRLVPVNVSPGTSSPDVRAYAVLAPNGTLHVTLINKSHGPGGRDAEAALAPGHGFARAEIMLLTGPGGDVQARSGGMLGGGIIHDDGKWNGSWTALPPPSNSGQFKLTVPAAAAAIVRMAPN